MQLHVLPEGGAEPAALLGCIRLIHWLSQPHALGPKPLTLVVDCGTGTTATGTTLSDCFAKLLNLDPNLFIYVDSHVQLVLPKSYKEWPSTIQRCAYIVHQG